MAFRGVSAAIGSVIVFTIGWATPVSAQGAGSPGCNAINGGTFNQDFDVVGAQLINFAFDFNAGERITVTITNALNSFANIGLNDLFDGDVGSLTRSVTLDAGGSFNVNSAIDGAGATIRFLCDPGGGGGGGAQNIVDEVTNAEATAQAVEDNVRLPVVPAALGTTFRTEDLLQQLEQKRVDQAAENRLLVRQGVDELARRISETTSSIEAARSGTNQTINQNVATDFREVIDAIKTSVVDELRASRNFTESELAETEAALDGAIIAGIIRTIAGVNTLAQSRDRARDDEASAPIDPFSDLARVFTGVDAREIEADTGEEILRIGFIQVTSDAFGKSTVSRSLSAEERGAVSDAILNAAGGDDQPGGPVVGAVQDSAVVKDLISQEVSLDSLRSDLRQVNDLLDKGDFKGAALLLEVRDIDLGTAGQAGADFDTTPRGGSSLGLGDGEPVLFSPVNDRTLDFAIDSDFIRRMASLADGGTGAIEQRQGADPKFWIKARAALLDGGRDGADGETAEVLIGAVQRLSPKLEVGAFAGFFTSDLTTNTLAADIETDALKLGLYGNYLTQNGLRLGLSSAVDLGDTETDRGGVTAQFNYRNYDFSGSVAGSLPYQEWFLSPSFSGTLSHRDTDKHTDSGGLFIAGRSDTEIIATASLAAARVFSVNQGAIRNITPSFVATGNYFFLGNNEQDDFEHLSLTLGGGATAVFSNGANLAVNTAVGGFGQDTMSYSGQLRLTFSF